MRWIILALALVSCGRPPTSALEGLGASGTGKNVAVLVGAAHGLGGVATDLRELKTVFGDSSYGFDFTAVANGDASVQDILDLTAQQSRDADSLFWYFSGHGNDDIMLATDSTFHFTQVANVIRNARNDRPLKRLVVMIDSCHSGSFVDGDNPIIDENGWLEPAVYAPLRTHDAKLYEQAFVLASSKHNEDSADLGSARGGAFTYSLRTTLLDLKAHAPLATFQDLADKTITLTQSEGGHTPVYKAFPSVQVMHDYVFLYQVSE